MANVRIRMPEGHNQLSIEGHTYHPDPEDGAFDVPEQHKDLLTRVLGGVLAPDAKALEAAADAAELYVAQQKALIPALEKEAAAARQRANAAKMKAAVAKRRPVTGDAVSSDSASTESKGEGTTPAS